MGISLPKLPEIKVSSLKKVAEGAADRLLEQANPAGRLVTRGMEQQVARAMDAVDEKVGRKVDAFEGSRVGRNTAGRFAGGVVRGLAQAVTGTARFAATTNATRREAGEQLARAAAQASVHPERAAQHLTAAGLESYHRDGADFVGQLASYAVPATTPLKAARVAVAVGRLGKVEKATQIARRASQAANRVFTPKVSFLSDVSDYPKGTMIDGSHSSGLIGEFHNMKPEAARSYARDLLRASRRGDLAFADPADRALFKKIATGKTPIGLGTGAILMHPLRALAQSRQAIDGLLTHLADEIHLDWQATARSSGKTERFKPITLQGGQSLDAAGLKRYLKEHAVPAAEQKHYRVEDGVASEDILALPNRKLSFGNRAENDASATVAINEVRDAIQAGQPLDQQLEKAMAAMRGSRLRQTPFLEQAGNRMHVEWMARNQTWNPPAEQMLPFAQLSAAEQQKDTAIIERAVKLFTADARKKR